jgi:AcrR family transcriptional regulator
MARPIDPNLKIQLLAAAEAEFARHGVEAARIDDIVRRAGRSKGSFYQYFASKEDAFGQISQALLAQLEKIITTELVDEKRPWTLPELLRRWRARDEAIFEFVWVNRDMVRMILMAGFHVAFAALMNQFARRTSAVVAEGMAWGRTYKIYRRDLDLRVVSAAIAGAYDRLARDVVESETRPHLKKWVNDLQRFILHGIIEPRAQK